MLDEILRDLEQLSKLIGDQSVIDDNTVETAQKIVEIAGTHGAAELDPAMQKILAIAFRSDLKKIYQVAATAEIKLSIKTIGDKYLERSRYTPPSSIAAVSVEEEHKHTEVRAVVPVLERPKPLPLHQSRMDDAHSRSFYPQPSRASVIGSTTSRLSTVSVARSTFFRGQASSVVTKDSLANLIHLICGNSSCRESIVTKFRTQIKECKNDSIRNKDAIICLEQAAVILLVRTELSLLSISETLEINFQQASITLPKKVLEFIKKQMLPGTEEDLTPSDSRQKMHFLQQVLPVIGGNNYKTYYKNACNFSVTIPLPSDEGSSARV